MYQGAFARREAWKGRWGSRRSLLEYQSVLCLSYFYRFLNYYCVILVPERTVAKRDKFKGTAEAQKYAEGHAEALSFELGSSPTQLKLPTLLDTQRIRTLRTYAGQVVTLTTTGVAEGAGRPKEASLYAGRP